MSVHNSDKSFSKVNNDNIKKAKSILRIHINKYNNFFININLISDDFIKTLLPLLIMDDIEPLLHYIDNINKNLKELYCYNCQTDILSNFFIEFTDLEESVFNKNEKADLKDKSIFIICYLKLLLNYINPNMIAINNIDKYINKDCETYIEAFKILNPQQIEKFCDEILVGKRDMEKNLTNSLHDIRRKYFYLMKSIKLINNDNIIRVLLDFLVNYDKDTLLFHLENINYKFMNSDYIVFDNRFNFIRQYESLKGKYNAVDLREKCIFIVKYLKLLYENIDIDYILNYIYNVMLYNNAHKVSEESINALEMLDGIQIKDLFNKILLEQEQHEQERKERERISMITDFLFSIYSENTV